MKFFTTFLLGYDSTKNCGKDWSGLCMKNQFFVKQICKLLMKLPLPIHEHLNLFNKIFCEQTSIEVKIANEHKAFILLAAVLLS